MADQGRRLSVWSFQVYGGDHWPHNAVSALEAAQVALADDEISVGIIETLIQGITLTADGAEWNGSPRFGHQGIEAM